MTALSVRQQAAQLRSRRQRAIETGAFTPERAAAALEAVGALWAKRLAQGWTPPEESSFPWPMVRVSLEGLLPGLQAAGNWLARVRASVWPSPPGPLSHSAGEGEMFPAPPLLGAGGGDVVAHVLAGNTPLLAWPGLAAALLAGAASLVKMSRGETLWPRLFVESLTEVDARLAALVHLDVWLGEDPRTHELVQSADAIIAYGSDASLNALRTATPEEKPFFGYGHALSVGLVLTGADISAAAEGFARDVLLYGQGGCLSPQTVLVESGACEAAALGAALTQALPHEAERLTVPPVKDAGVALAVRQARDVALFMPGATVRADPGLRWSVITFTQENPMAAPAGHGVVTVSPIRSVATGFGPALGAARGRVSSVGVAGVLGKDVRDALLREGVSRICAPGEMQAPPLDWPNGGHDLLESLLRGRPGSGG